MSPPIRTVSLSAFSSHAACPVRALSVQVGRDGDALSLGYVLDGRIDGIRVPPSAVPRARDELWKHTCFEAFIALGAGRYLELNFSPSTEWAAYSFEGYRQGMCPLALTEAPRISVEASASLLRVNVGLNQRALLDGARGSSAHAHASALPAVGQTSVTPKLRLALTAVVECADGTHTYWALKHASARPDFHDPAGFVLEV